MAQKDEAPAVDLVNEGSNLSPFVEVMWNLNLMGPKSRQTIKGIPSFNCSRCIALKDEAPAEGLSSVELQTIKDEVIPSFNAIALKDGATAEDLPNVTFETSEDVEVIPSFDAMGLKEDVLRGIYAYGFLKPSPIQQRCIKPIAEGRNIIVQDSLGTGIASLSISILQSLDTSLDETQVLCLSSTRDLALQIKKIVLAIGQFMNVQCNVCIGGTNVRENKRELQNGQHIVSGTLGRVFDMIERCELCTSTIKVLVLNGDALLMKNDFKAQVDKVFHHLPSQKQVILISETLDQEILKISSNLIKDPIVISVKGNSKEPGSKTKTANKPSKKINRQFVNFDKLHTKPKLEHLESLTKYQLIEECLKIEEAQRQMYMSQIKIINEKVQELTKEIHNLRSQIKRPWVFAAAPTSSPSAPRRARREHAHIASLIKRNKSNSSMSCSTSRSSSSSNEDRSEEQEEVEAGNGQIPTPSEIMFDLDNEDDDINDEFGKDTSNDGFQGKQNEDNAKIN